MMTVELTWLGHASFRIAGSVVVYIDPWKLEGPTQGDVVVVSHSHYDHLSVDDVRAVAGPQTRVVAAGDCTSKLDGLNVQAAAPGDRVELEGVVLEVVAAYNIDKPFHPKEENWLGLIVNLDGQRIYYAGDTDAIPEMADLADIDLALMPVGGTYTMTAAEAAEALGTFNPRQAVPYHWGDIVGEENDAEAFKAAAACEVTILQPGESLTLG
jgi:L-ascorbate metabolism protein UlaG (beta-lactamase superfamily)